MKLGVHIGYWGLGLSSDDQLTIVTEAERLGYDSVWAAEAYGSDTATVLGWLAGQTSKIRLGAGIFQMPGRSPAMTAMTAATIDELSGGRMLLGSLACFVHGLLPWMCLTRGSDTIRALHHRMVTHRTVRSEQGRPAPDSSPAVAAAD